MNRLDRDKWRRVCDDFEGVMRAHQIPGASLGIISDGEALSAGFGVTSIENPLPVDPATLFQIGSITKTFTCAATMGLVESGKLRLEDTVRSVLPSFRVADEEATEAATIWHLLTHTAGWLGDFFIDTGPDDDALARYAARMSQLPQVAPIGLQYSYNNASFGLLGHILELVEGRPFEQIVTRSIFEPVGLKHCYFRLEDLMTRRFVVGHRLEPQGPQVATPWGMPRNDSPVGAIVTNVDDLLIYAQLMLDGGRTQGGTQLLNTESVAAMQKAQAKIWGEAESIGLAWHIERHAGRAFFNHGGATTGQGAYLEYCPELGFALVILANSDMARHLVRAVRRQVFGEFLGVKLPVPDPAPVDLATTKEVEGRYVLPGLGFLEIRPLAGRLICQEINTGSFPTEDTPPEPSPPPYTLELIEPDRLIIADGKDKDITCEILRDETGRMQWFRKSGRIHIREPIPEN
jgi:CubicO group peptidase (beta-lactamase class C family)